MVKQLSVLPKLTVADYACSTSVAELDNVCVAGQRRAEKS